MPRNRIPYRRRVNDDQPLHRTRNRFDDQQDDNDDAYFTPADQFGSFTARPVSDDDSSSRRYCTDSGSEFMTEDAFNEEKALPLRPADAALIEITSSNGGASAEWTADFSNFNNGSSNFDSSTNATQKKTNRISQFASTVGGMLLKPNTSSRATVAEESASSPTKSRGERRDNDASQYTKGESNTRMNRNLSTPPPALVKRSPSNSSSSTNRNKSNRISWAAQHEETEVQRWINAGESTDDISLSNSSTSEDGNFSDSFHDTSKGGAFPRNSTSSSGMNQKSLSHYVTGQASFREIAPRPHKSSNGQYSKSKEKSVKSIMNIFDSTKSRDSSTSPQSNDPWDDIETSTIASSHVPSSSELDGSYISTNDNASSTDLFENEKTLSTIDTSASMRRIHQKGKHLRSSEDMAKNDIFRKGNKSKINAPLSAPFRHPRGAVVQNGERFSDVPNLMDDEMTSTSIASPRFSPTNNFQNTSSPDSTSPSSLYFTDDFESEIFSNIPEDSPVNGGRSSPFESFNPRSSIENSLLVNAALNSHTSHLIKDEVYGEANKDSILNDRKDLNTSEEFYQESTSNYSGTLIGENVIDSMENNTIEGIAFSSGTSISASRSYYSDSDSSFYGDGLDQYYIQPRIAQRLVKRYRRLCVNDPDEDATKYFALSEMRSRIMESDIERGLDRRGWTFPVDDLILTPSNLAAMRVRDAVIVAKAWRDGANPSDVMTAWVLGRRYTHSYHILRCHGRRYFYEPVRWCDDTDLSIKRCLCVDVRCTRGFDMFTIGDCQSMLLKLTNERYVVRFK